MTLVLSDVVDVLACPVCGRVLRIIGASLRCPGGHAFDVARQGYVTLLPPRGSGHTGDTAEMVARRAAFLGAGHYAPVAAAVARAVADVRRHADPRPGDDAAVVLDIGAGTGYYLGHVLDDAASGLPRGLALDVSRYAARRAARAHARAAAVVADAWARLPVRDASVDVVLSVFAPRSAPEIFRVLRPGGALVTVTPTGAHLREIVGPLGLLTVDENKDHRLRAALDGRMQVAAAADVAFGMHLDRSDVEGLALMGPSAWHVDAERLAAQVATLPAVTTVTASVTVTTFRLAREPEPRAPETGSAGAHPGR